MNAPTCALSQKDYDAATRRGEKLKAYWADKGFDVQVWLTENGFSQTTRCNTYAVQTDMINGLPRGWHEKQGKVIQGLPDRPPAPKPQLPQAVSKKRQRLNALAELSALNAGVSVGEVFGKSRKARVAAARHEFMYRARCEGFTSAMIGRFLGKDHSSVLYGSEKYANDNGLPMLWSASHA